MKIKAETHSLRDAINKILSVIDKKNSRAILTNCLISAKENTLEINATDLEVSAKVVVNCEVIEGGKFCINTKNIFDILKELPNDLVEISLESSQNLLNLSCKNINYSLLIANAEDYPTLQFETQNESTFTLKSEVILDIINKTSHAISSDETRIFLNGIYLQQIQSKLRAVAIDGHRLALLDIDDFSSQSNQLENGVIVPRKGINELKKLAENNLSSNITISLDESYIYLNADNKYMLSVRLISREYPKYQTVIPNKTTKSFRLDRNEFLNSIKRIKLLSNEKTNGIKVSLKQDSMVLSANHPSLGHATETLPISYNDDEIEIGFNARYLAEALSTLNDSEITFEFNNELSPVVIKSEELPNFLGIVMPLKL